MSQLGQTCSQYAIIGQSGQTCSQYAIIGQSVPVTDFTTTKCEVA